METIGNIALLVVFGSVVLIPFGASLLHRRRWKRLSDLLDENRNR